MTGSDHSGAGMGREQLREIIVQAATPFIAEWETTTTAQIARAAGIDESALLSVFADAQATLTAALHALVRTALDPTRLVQDLHAIALNQPLAVRLAGAIDALDTYHQRMVAGLASLATSTPESRTAGETRSRQFDHEDLRSVARMDVIGEAVATLLEPDQDQLRLPAATLAGAFLGMYSARRRISPGGLIDLFLHGALTGAEPD